MKSFLKNVVKRIGDLIIKLIAVKVVAAGVMTALAFIVSTDFAVACALVAWITVVGARAYEKAVGVVKPLLPSSATTPAPKGDGKAGDP